MPPESALLLLQDEGRSGPWSGRHSGCRCLHGNGKGIWGSRTGPLEFSASGGDPKGNFHQWEPLKWQDLRLENYVWECFLGFYVKIWGCDTALIVTLGKIHEFTIPLGEKNSLSLSTVNPMSLNISKPIPNWVYSFVILYLYLGWYKMTPKQLLGWFIIAFDLRQSVDPNCWPGH
jgi:hypothetical protein